MKNVFFLGIACLCSVGAVMAQTTLSGDHIITGDLDIGSTGALGGLKVNGETGNTAAPGVKVTGDGGVLFEGALGTGQIPATGVGTRFMWYPKKAAFRAGSVSSTQWDDSNIGNYSVAFSQNSLASGAGAVSFRGNATGQYSFSFGGTASGVSSFSMGQALSMAAGTEALAFGSFSSASGENSFAFGFGSMASNYGAVAFGSGTSSAGMLSSAHNNADAIGDYSFASGQGGLASGLCSVVSGGYFPVASGNYTFASGYQTSASSAYSFVLGRNNAVEGTATAWVDNDPLFVVGNGTGEIADSPELRYRNAFVIRKNGNVEMTAKVMMPRQGDILMGEFGNPE